MTKVLPSIRSSYDHLFDDYEELAKFIDELLRPLCNKKKWHYESRIKSLTSFAQKLETGRYTKAKKIDDYFACTIVVQNLEHIQKAEKEVGAVLNVIKRLPKATDATYNAPTDFRFDGLRLYAKVKTVNPKKEYENLLFEIQIKTFLDHAWSYATHDFSYKSSKVNWARERLAAQIKASLDQIDATITNVDEIVKSPIFNKRNKDYVKKEKILNYLLNWDKGLLPTDVKRLVEILFEFEKNIGLSIDEIRNAVKAATSRGRGKKLVNLSAYGIVVQSLLDRRNPKFVEYLLAPAKGKKLKVLITDDIQLPKELYKKTLKGATSL